MCPGTKPQRHRGLISSTASSKIKVGRLPLSNCTGNMLGLADGVGIMKREISMSVIGIKP
jgi:hypothetical protein